MWAADAPPVTATETAEACAESIRDNVLKRTLLEAVKCFADNSDSYRKHGLADSLHEVTAGRYPVPGLSGKQLRWVYEQQLVRKSAGGRRVYDRLMSAAPRGLCVYCRHSVASTLDHFVPKVVVGEFSIEPWNLVPCCKECNHRLSFAWSTDSASQMLHPYFLRGLGRWLRASVAHEGLATVCFYADPEKRLEAALAQRIKDQFDRLGLGLTYEIVSAQELSSTQRCLQDSSFTQQQTRQYLTTMAAAAFEDDANDRRGVLYEALANDDRFVAEHSCPV